jgi:negative regulator of flagellin synthesis FlgM
MKIQGNSPNQNAGVDNKLDVARSAAAKTQRAGDANGSPSGDTVQLSSDAKFAAAAIDAAQQAPDVRADKVARAKQLLESGELGADAGKLADAMIDSMLEK